MRNLRKDGKPITKKEAIEFASNEGAKDYKFKFLQWVKMPCGGRMIVYEQIMPDFLDSEKTRIETRYHVFVPDGGGSGGGLGSRTEKK